MSIERLAFRQNTGPKLDRNSPLSYLGNCYTTDSIARKARSVNSLKF